MASISRDPGGRRRVLFTAPDGKRKAIRLGKVPQRAAEATKVKVENLLAAKVSGCGWDNETARWVAELPDELAGKLAAVGLIPVRDKVTLAAFVDSYVQGRLVLQERLAGRGGASRCRAATAPYLADRATSLESGIEKL